MGGWPKKIGERWDVGLKNRWVVIMLGGEFSNMVTPKTGWKWGVKTPATPLPLDA